MNYRDSGSAEEICEMSSKIVTFLDLAGHQKYLKTTIFGLTGHIPDFAMLVIAANAGVGRWKHTTLCAPVFQEFLNQCGTLKQIHLMFMTV